MTTVLLVESEPIARNYLKQALGGDCLFLEAKSAVQALDLCRGHREIDLLVSDVELGLISGMELASLLRAWLPRLRTILTSDLPCDQWTDRQQTELSELPPDDVLILERPFTAAEAHAALLQLVRSPMAAVAGASARS
ncbi:MAG TPA: response regulator [Bryobacteraceae bacterium]|nr:response regulator [Bryobacteraceae bacterium]